MCSTPTNTPLFGIPPLKSRKIKRTYFEPKKILERVCNMEVILQKPEYFELRWETRQTDSGFLSGVSMLYRVHTPFIMVAQKWIFDPFGEP